MTKQIAEAFHKIPPEAFPITIQIFSGSTGEVLWSAIVEKPQPIDSWARIEIPGFGGTKHAPVRVEVKYGDELKPVVCS